MKEAYVSYEVAKLLKEKGFDWYTYHYYDEIGRTWFEDILCDWNHRTTPEVSCPTQQMACDWVEKTYGFFIEISRSVDTNGDYHYRYGILDKRNFVTRINNAYQSKENAVEAALKYVLTNLI